MPIKRYIKKPIPIEALQIVYNPDEIHAFLGENVSFTLTIDSQNVTVIIHAFEGDMIAHFGDYIIKGIKGEFYPCRRDVFEESYTDLLPGVDS